MKKMKRVTSTDVAKEAGVSRATVSYILNNVENVRIKDETRKKVLQAAKKLGYHPDSMAVALKTNKSMSIGIVSKRNVSEQRYIKFLDGVRSVMTSHQYSIILCSDTIDESGYPEYYSYYKRRKIDGILFLSFHEHMSEENIEENTRMAISEDIPIVFADYHMKNPMVDCVDINYYHGAYTATKNLIEQGHKKIAYMRPEFITKQEQQRLDGVKEAINGSDILELIEYPISKGRDSLTEVAREVLSNRKQHTAVVTSWNNMAHNVIYEAHKEHVSIPEELSVMALAGSHFDGYAYPKLSTCDLPLFDLGKKSAETLMSKLKEPKTLPLNISLPCKLNSKDSCKSI